MVSIDAQQPRQPLRACCWRLLLPLFAFLLFGVTAPRLDAQDQDQEEDEHGLGESKYACPRLMRHLVRRGAV